jgi:hypothetical protein
MATGEVRLLLEDRALDAGILARLTRLELRESDDAPSVLALRFRLRQRPGGEFDPLDDEAFRPGAALSAELAAPGGVPARLFHGLVTHLRPHFEPIEANCFLEVIGMDAAALMDATDRAVAWPDTSASEIATEICRRYDVMLEAESSDTTWAEEERLLVQRGSDWAFLRRLAAAEGKAFWLEWNEDRGTMGGWFGRLPLEAPPQADLAILQDGAALQWIDVEFVATGGARVIGAAIDPVRKRLVRGEAEAALPALGADAAADAIEDALRGAAGGGERWLDDPLPLDTALAAQSAGATDGARLALEIRGGLDPALYRGLLRAKRPVLVRGVGARFSGIWWVRAVRTVMEEGVLSQSFIARRNAFGPRRSDPFGQSAEEVPPT